jgi:hypothetical protein
MSETFEPSPSLSFEPQMSRQRDASRRETSISKGISIISRSSKLLQQESPRKAVMQISDPQLNPESGGAGSIRRYSPPPQVLNRA